MFLAQKFKTLLASGEEDDGADKREPAHLRERAVAGAVPARRARPQGAPAHRRVQGGRAQDQVIKEGSEPY